MIRTLLLLLLVVCTLGHVRAQSNLGINYQAVVRDADNNPIANQPVSFRFSYAPEGDTSNVDFVESFTVTTNEFGLTNLVLTFGTVESGSLSDLDFSANDYWLMTELDIAGGTDYEFMGLTPFEKVPYAEVAGTARNVDDADADAANEIQQLTLDGDQLTLSQGGGSITLPPSEDAAADPTNELELPANPSAGDLVYYNGETQDWQTVNRGLPGQVLVLTAAGNPRWSGPSTSELIEIELRNGEILYFHPTDNSLSIRSRPESATSNPITFIYRFPDVHIDYNGEANTQVLLNFYADQPPTEQYAAKFCDELVAYGFSDWYLPAAGEISQLAARLISDDMPASGQYITSTTHASYDGQEAYVAVADFSTNKYVDYVTEITAKCRCARR